MKLRRVTPSLDVVYDVPPVADGGFDGGRLTWIYGDAVDGGTHGRGR